MHAARPTHYKPPRRVRRQGTGLRGAPSYYAATGCMKRFIVIGSFVTTKPEPNDVDVFLVMHDTFDLNQVTGEARTRAGARGFVGAGQRFVFIEARASLR